MGYGYLDMNIEREFILSIVREICSGGERDNIEKLLNLKGLDWEKVKNCMIYHEIVSLGYSVLKEYFDLLPRDFRRFLKNKYYYGTLRNECLWGEFLRLIEIFGQKDIVLIPVKGMALFKDIYSNPSLRNIGDIDLLVKNKDILKAEEILYNLGYERESAGLKENYWREKQYHIIFLKRNHSRLSAIVELHWRLDYKRKKDILPLLWSRLRRVDIDNRSMYSLSCEDTFFSLALHNRRLGKVLCMKSVFDLFLLLKKYSNFDWDYVLKEAKSGNMRTTVFFILSQANFFFGLSISKDILKNLAIPFYKRKLICQFIEKNTFLPDIKEKIRDLYLKSHFLLYDNFREPVEYILNIPIEQFAKFYGIKSYDRKTYLFYRFRCIYIPAKYIKEKLSYRCYEGDDKISGVKREKKTTYS